MVGVPAPDNTTVRLRPYGPMSEGFHVDTIATPLVTAVAMDTADMTPAAAAATGIPSSMRHSPVASTSEWNASLSTRTLERRGLYEACEFAMCYSCSASSP